MATEAVVFGAIVLMALAVGGFIFVRARRAQREIPEVRRVKELTEGMERRRKRRIARAVRRGRAVPDPRDADVAVAVARQALVADEILSSGRLARALHLLFLVLAVLALAGGVVRNDFGGLRHFAFITIAALGAYATRRVIRVRAERALAANSRLLESVAPRSEQLPVRSRDPATPVG